MISCIGLVIFIYSVPLSLKLFCIFIWVLKVKTVWDPWILEFLLINKTAQTIVENKYPQILIAYSSRPMLLIQNGPMMEGADGSRNFNYIITMWVH